MRRRALSDAALIAAVALGTAVHSQRVFRSGVDLVYCGVTVTDRKGNFVRGLTVDDFEVVEEGRAQTIRYFIAGDKAEDAPPLHLGLLFDTSGSMTDDVKFSRTAAVKFLNALPHAADITFVDFDTEVRVARYGQSDVPRIIERIRMRKPDGWTALYDAIGTYLSGAQDQDGQKVFVVYTDGGDTRSQTDFGAVLDMLKMSDVTMYAVGFLEHQFASTRTEQRMRLQQLAAATGGVALFPSSAEQLESMYDKILDEMSARYSLGYLSSDPRANGAWRQVKVRLKRPELKDARIRTRAGYFAPLREAAR